MYDDENYYPYSGPGSDSSELTPGSAGRMFYGYTGPGSDSSYAGYTYGNSYGGGTNGNAYGGWTASNPLSGNNAFSGNRGSLGQGTAQNYDPRQGMINGGSTVGDPRYAWNLSAPGVDPTGGADYGQNNSTQPPTAWDDVQRWRAGQMVSGHAGGYSDPFANTPPDTNPSGGSVHATKIGTGVYEYTYGNNPFNANQNNSTPSNVADGSREPMRYDMKQSLDSGFGGTFKNQWDMDDEGYNPTTPLDRSMSPYGTARNAMGESDWDNSWGPQFDNANNQPQFDPSKPTISPFGQDQAPKAPTAFNADDYETYSKAAMKRGKQLLSPQDWLDQQNRHNEAYRAAAGPPAIPATGQYEPTNDKRNYNRDGLYIGPARPGMESVTAPPEVSSKQLQQQRKGLQMQPGQTLAPFSAQPGPVSSAPIPPQNLIASANQYNTPAGNIFEDNMPSVYQPGRSQADPVLDGLLQEMQQRHDPATIQKILKMIKPSGSSRGSIVT